MFSWVTSLIAHGGPWSLFWLMALENVFPPLPSELILPMAGYDVARGTMSLSVALAAATAGSVVGAFPLYGVARLVGVPALRRWAQRHGRWLTVSPEEIETADTWFKPRGFLVVLIGRSLPGIRGVVPLPAGLSRQPLASFSGALTLGSLIWSAILLSFGLVLRSHFSTVDSLFNPISNALLAAVLLTYAYRVFTWRKRHS